MSEVLDRLISLGRRDIAVETDPERLQPADVPYQCGSSARLQRETGWQPRIPFGRTLSDLLEHWRRVVAN
jgi:GDPmannose 4,6-dehydratase